MLFQEWLICEKQNVGYDFSSVQAMFPASFAKRVIAWSKKNISDDDIYVEGKKYGREDEIHVTVLYGLHSNIPSSVQKALKDFGPFSIRLGKVTKFDNKDEYDVLKIDVESKQLHQMNKALRKLPNSSKYPVYHPHCTLAYVKKGACKGLVGNKDFVGEEITIDRVDFSPSVGNDIEVRLCES